MTISKLQELDNIRGLVMAETSELDTTIEEILVGLMDREDDTSAKLRQYAIAKVKENTEQRNQFLATIDKMSNVEIIKNRAIFDANKKSRTLNEYFKLSGMASENDLKEFHKNYEANVLLVRNDLAHAKSEKIDGIEYLIVLRKGTEHPVKYNQEECIKIRKTLRAFSEVLEKVREKMVANGA